MAVWAVAWLSLVVDSLTEKQNPVPFEGLGIICRVNKSSIATLHYSQETITASSQHFPQ